MIVLIRHVHCLETLLYIDNNMSCTMMYSILFVICVLVCGGVPPVIYSVFDSGGSLARIVSGGSFARPWSVRGSS